MVIPLPCLCHCDLLGAFLSPIELLCQAEAVNVSEFGGDVFAVFLGRLEPDCLTALRASSSKPKPALLISSTFVTVREGSIVAASHQRETRVFVSSLGDDVHRPGGGKVAEMRGIGRQGQVWFQRPDESYKEKEKPKHDD
jgi:hypothetical protein